MGSYNPGDEVNFGIETDEWDTMSDYEKTACINRLQNYNVMKALGFGPDLPEFLSPISATKPMENIVRQRRKKFKREEKNDESSLNIPAISAGPAQERDELQNETELNNCSISETPDITASEEHGADNDGLLRFSEKEITDAIRTYNVFSTLLNGFKSLLRVRKHRRKQKWKNLSKKKGKKVYTHIQDNKPTLCVKKKNHYDNCVDELFYCDACNNDWVGVCPIHGALLFMGDNCINHDLFASHALYTTPLLLLTAACQKGFGVWTRCAVPPMVIFGPYTGEITSKPDDYGFSWQIVKNGRLSHYISGLNVFAGNWMRYVKLARFEEEINLLAFQYKGYIYYRTFKQISAKTELKVWYVGEYFDQLGDVSSVLLSETSSQDELPGLSTCTICKEHFHSELFLKTHIKYNHHRRKKKTKIVKKTRKVKNNNLDNSLILHKQNFQIIDETDIKTEVDIMEDLEQEFKYRMEKLVIEKLNLIEYNVENILPSNDIMSDIKSEIQPEESVPRKRGRPPPFKDQWNTDLKSELKIHHCDQCDFTSDTVRKLSQHKIAAHENGKFYACSVCQYKFKGRSKLVYHMRTHKEEKAYNCEQCGYKTDLVSNLRRHMRKHTGEKPYECEQCGVRFADTGHLKRHAKSHTDEKPFACVHCVYRARNLETLRRHIRIHTGERPFPCPFCPYKGNQRSNLNLHLKTHEKV